MARERSALAALSVIQRELGSIFEVRALGFNPVVLSGPQACHWVLVDARTDLLWRMETDPITQLLSHGLLVEDGAAHDDMREALGPALHRRMVEHSLAAMIRRTDQIIDTWSDGDAVDLLVESRRIALLVLFDALFDIEHTPDMPPLWPPLLKMVDYIAPGFWMFWSGVPRPGYKSAIAQWNTYFAHVIATRRAELDHSPDRSDMLSLLIRLNLPDSMIRDQLMTMLIAGHDTVTALLGWAFYLLGKHDDIRKRCTNEADSVFGDSVPTPESLSQLKYTQQVLDETLRLYPPAHLGSRKAARDLEFNGYHIPEGRRVVYSIYLTQRDPALWPDPDRFNPERFAPGRKIAPYTFLPFGGGKRNCIGAYFAQIEARAVVARILQRVTLQAVPVKTHIHMGATIEPRPGVPFIVKRR
jgi:cytochrome P450